MNIPNKLSISRIVIAFTMIILFVFMHTNAGDFKTNAKIYTILFMIGVGTDFLDGYIARKKGQKTVLGEFLDPIADKILVNTTMITIFAIIAPTIGRTIWGLIFILALIIQICRDSIVNFSRIILARNSLNAPAMRGGKYKTATQMISLTLFLVWLWFPGWKFITQIWLFQTGIFFLIIATGFSLFSGCVYVNKTLKTLKGKALL